MLAMPGAVNEMDSSNEGAADLTIIVRSAAKKIKKFMWIFILKLF